MKNEGVIRFLGAVEYLTPQIQSRLKALPSELMAQICEIRLTAGAPIVLSVNGRQTFLNGEGVSFLPPTFVSAFLRAEELKACFVSLCENSVYAHGKEIREGFIILKYGHRAGIAGQAVYEQSGLSTFRAISSINIRIAKQMKGVGLPFLEVAKQTGLLIAGPPGTGKTTLLRDLVRLLSIQPCRVSLVDARGEIAASLQGLPQNDVGFCTDVLTGIQKAEGIDIALRCLNPEYLVFDELASMEETDKIIHCFYAGVKVLCTAHAGSIEELYSRPFSGKLLKSGCVQNVIFLPSLRAKPILHNVYEKGGVAIA